MWRINPSPNSIFTSLMADEHWSCEQRVVADTDRGW